MAKVHAKVVSTSQTILLQLGVAPIDRDIPREMASHQIRPIVAEGITEKTQDNLQLIAQI